MYLKTLYLRNFRNYLDFEVHFSDRLNVFYGNNGEGKTNLLEAIYFLSTGRSFRTNKLQELISHGKDFFYLEAVFEKNNLEETLKIYFDANSKKIYCNEKKYLSFHQLLGCFPTVLHTPHDAELVEGSPGARRRFLNLYLAQQDPIYIHHWVRYWKAMKQRNTLLKRKVTDTIDCWEEQMANSAAYLTQKRAIALDELSKPLESFNQQFNPKDEPITLKYTPSSCSHIQNAKQEYTRLLQSNRKKELLLGSTITGPHRDDFLISLKNQAAKSFASEGQKRSCAISLKLAEWEKLCQHTNLPAIMGFDDLGMHLDASRQSLLKQLLSSLHQVFITTPYEPDALYEGKCQFFQIQKGKITDISNKPLLKET